MASVGAKFLPRVRSASTSFEARLERAVLAAGMSLVAVLVDFVLARRLR